MMRIWRFNACKDYLVSNVGVIAGGHYEEILNARLITITFIFSSFACVFDLPDCVSTLMLAMMTVIIVVIC